MASMPAGNNIVKSIVIYTENEEKKYSGFSLINYISNDGSSIIAPAKTERS